MYSEFYTVVTNIGDLILPKNSDNYLWIVVSINPVQVYDIKNYRVGQLPDGIYLEDREHLIKTQC